ncbi:flagellar motor protein MotA [Paracoccus sp. S4493]|jgi:chemotaxis protein MotA|uniref:flagellar motor stator protein MotA n=1 Tax=Paracoccus TaxID=265 RepID=UPI0005E9D3B3|nr:MULTISPECIES: flagellar motor stator protein MotA [Paracoccus]TYP67510.1 chemotaxis protein MotA [Stutzerimonas stutzeri]KIX17640.1 flagellar motor protein MotA [Paracoccus sp. 228]KJZ31049.1 flagellar motor protein MotA [Paracoccus sp. S4493]MBF5079279.1 flagellar motor stator protein MotA [Paracoccus sp. NBH48]MCO6362444.1 flagellar motor stator protein MotA [Paracoccus sp. 08]|tara:strand:+ start:571 stop:1437 length:867 start_codon:yes stop_codon:yes gene_type:complete
MFGFVGIFLTIAMVFGGYLLAGGKMGVILHSLPFEMMMIMGAAVGAYLLGNDSHTLKATLGGLIRAFKGPKWNAQDHQDVLCLMFQLLKIAKENPVALEQHIENPGESPIFTAYPKLAADHHVVSLIADTLRSASLNYDDPYQVEDMLSRRIAVLKEEEMHVPHALQNMADALPALGIVAAVLGVIKTMSSIDQPPSVLGKMIGGALVGTFLGVFLSYGFVAPLANRLGAVVKQDLGFYEVVKSVLVAGLHQHATTLCVEVGRQTVPEHVRPSFDTLEGALRELKKAA